MQHQEGCPLGAVSAYGAAARRGVADYVPALDDSEKERPCPDRRCTTWLDLHTWFGYADNSLPQIDFQKCFCDIAHGGGGVYERLAVLGEKALDFMAKVYISDKFCPAAALPFELQRGFPPDLMRYIWSLKRVDRVLSLRALSSFAKSYLATAQSLPTASSAARYTKALTGYAIQAQALLRTAFAENHALETMAYRRDNTMERPTRKLEPGTLGRDSLVYQWAGILLDHIYETQKLHSLADPVEAELIQDLQEYFGYPYDTPIPRIRNIINANETCFTEADFDAQAQTGRDILRLWLTQYFVDLAKHSQLDQTVIKRWLRLELETFCNSQVIAIFAATHFNLLPILNHLYKPPPLAALAAGPAGELIDSIFGAPDTPVRRVPNPSYDAGLAKIERMFLQLLAATYAVVPDTDSQRYMPALCQRLRQVQLILHLEEIDIRMNGTVRSPLALFQGIDIYRWSTIAHWGQHDRFGLWHHKPESRHLEAFLPVSDPVIRRRIRQLEEHAPPPVQQPQRVCRLLCPPVAPPSGECRPPPVQEQPAVLPVVNAGETFVQRFVTNKNLPNSRRRAVPRNPDLQNGYWRPPFAAFMAPRQVEFPKGEAYVAPHKRRSGPAKCADARRQPDGGEVVVDWQRQPPPPAVIDVNPPLNSNSGSSSYCSSCSTCVDEDAHDCKGWNSVLRQVQHNAGTAAQPRAAIVGNGGDHNMLITDQGKTRTIDLYRRRMDPDSIPFTGAGLNGGARTARQPLGGTQTDVLNAGSDRLDEFASIPALQKKMPVDLGSPVIGLDLSRSEAGQKHLRVRGPPGMEFSPPPDAQKDFNDIDVYF